MLRTLVRLVMLAGAVMALVLLAPFAGATVYAQAQTFTQAHPHIDIGGEFKNRA